MSSTCGKGLTHTLTVSRLRSVCVCVNDIYTKVGPNDNYHNDDYVHSCVWNGMVLARLGSGFPLLL